MRFDDIGYHHKHDAAFINDRPNGSGDWLLLIIKSATVFRIRGTEQRVKKDSFMLYTPDFPQYYRADGEAYIDDWIHFEPAAAELALFERLQIPVNQPVELADVSSISKLIQEMCYEFYSAQRNRIDIAQLYFHLVLFKINEQMDTPGTSGALRDSIYNQQLLWIREKIYRYPTEKYNIDNLAAELFLSRSRFQHLYMQVLGTSVTQEIINSKIQFACKLLKETNQSIEAVVHACGYQNVSYFSILFQKAMGKTLRQYRQDETNAHASKGADVS